MRRLVSLFLTLLFLAAAPANVASAEAISFLGEGDEKPPLFTGSPSEEWVYEPLEVHFIDVGRADSILLRSGEYTLLLDSGVPASARQIVAYLSSIGVTRLTYAFGSHPHDDHIGGFPEVFEEIPVGTYLQPALFDGETNAYVKRLDAALARHQIPVQTVADGTVMAFGSSTLRFFQWQKESARINNRSMLLRAQCGDRSVLFAADIEEHAQRALAAQYGALLKADILKFPHHGLAAYMEVFHKAVQPAFCVISNAERRIEKTIRILKRKSIPWLLTTAGSVVAVTDGGRWQVWQMPNL